MKVFDPDHYLDGGPVGTAADGDPNDKDPDKHDPDDNYGSGVGILPWKTQITFGPGEQSKPSEELSIPEDARQPGNNYSAGVHGREEWLERYRFQEDNGTTLIAHVAGGQDWVVPAEYQTPMLTVWRTLWVERDDMVAPGEGDGPFDGAGVGNDDVQFDPWEPDIALASVNLAAACVRVEALPAQYDQKDGVAFTHNLGHTGMQGVGNAVRDV